MVGTNNRADPKYAKAVVIKQPGQLFCHFDDSVPAFTLQQRGWIITSGLHNSGLCSPELNFSLFCNIPGSGLDRFFFFLRNRR